MNAEPKKTEQPAQRLSFRQALKQAPGRFVRMCAHNWGWKLLSLLLAVGLWAGLITQDPTLTRERVFADVPVSVTGTDALIRNGMVVLSGLNEEALTIRLRADVPQRAYSATMATNYNPRVDVSRVSEVGEQTLKISTTSSTTYGTVDSVTPDSVTVMVDYYVTNYRVPVSLNIIGDYPDGFYGSTPLLDPGSVAVSGPQSVVDRIAGLHVDFDLSLLPAREGLVRTALPMRFVDANGAEIANDMLSVTSANVVLRTITVEQRLYPTKTLRVSSQAAVTGMPESGYEVKSITAVPETVLAAGDLVGLDALDALFAETPVSVEGANASFTMDITLRRPGSVVYLSDNVVHITVEIGPVLVSRAFDNIKLTERNVENGLVPSVPSSTVGVTVTGPQNAMAKLNANRLTAYVDAEGLSEGTHALPVLVDVKADGAEGMQCAVSPSQVIVTLKQR